MVEINKESVTQIMQQLEPMLTQIMAGMKIPGANIAVTNKTEVFCYKSFGVKNIETKENIESKFQGTYESYNKINRFEIKYKGG